MPKLKLTGLTKTKTRAQHTCIPSQATPRAQKLSEKAHAGGQLAPSMQLDLQRQQEPLTRLLNFQATRTQAAEVHTDRPLPLRSDQGHNTITPPSADGRKAILNRQVMANWEAKKTAERATKTLNGSAVVMKPQRLSGNLGIRVKGAMGPPMQSRPQVSSSPQTSNVSPCVASELSGQADWTI